MRVSSFLSSLITSLNGELLLLHCRTEKQINKSNKSQNLLHVFFVLVNSLSTSPLLAPIAWPRSISPDHKCGLKILFLAKYFCCDCCKINMKSLVPQPVMKPNCILFSLTCCRTNFSIKLSTIFRISVHFHFLKHMSPSLTKGSLQTISISLIAVECSDAKLPLSSNNSSYPNVVYHLTFHVHSALF